MKRLSVGLGSVMLLVIFAAYGGDDKKAATAQAGKAGAGAAVNSNASGRDATREAIRRSVLGESNPQTVPKKRYEPVGRDEIDQYVGSWVKLETYFGRKVEGTLRRVNGDILYIDEHLGQGSASYPINKTKLSGLKVLR